MVRRPLGDPGVAAEIMNLFTMFREAVAQAVAELGARGDLPAEIDCGAIVVEPPRDPDHGDVTTNAAMVLSKAAGQKPRDLAGKLAAALGRHPAVRAADVAGPGFINLRLADSFWIERLAEILRTGVGYGDSESGQGIKVNVEYVSANPTGPLHVGHGRGAVFGDALANLLSKAGYKVTREYYINDAGAQIEALAKSHFLRLRELAGEAVGAGEYEGLYPGEYVAESARKFPASLRYQSGQAFAERRADIEKEAIASMLRLIRDDLAALGIHHEVFTSEREINATGEVQAAYDLLKAKGLIYHGVLEPPKGMKLDDWEPREQDLFRSSQFGDDVDRPLKKSDGSWTYFAGDIAYHYDKFRRGFAQQIDVWGADHAGYVKRVNAAVKALSGGAAELDVKICQLVNLLDGGQPVKMSKRSGSFVTLREVIERVGRDVVRFIMLTRKNDAPLDFDFQKVSEQSKDNPVFYVQYAHARVASLKRRALEAWPDGNFGDGALAAAELARLTHPAELALIRRIAAWPQVVESAARAHEPHRVAFYLYDVAAAFHALWNMGNDDPGLRFVLAEDIALSRARLALARGVALVIASGLAVIGVTPADEMR